MAVGSDVYGGLEQKWWARRDSNPQPSGYEPPALTIELQARRGTCPVPAGQWQTAGGIGSSGKLFFPQDAAVIPTQSMPKKGARDETQPERTHP